MAELEFHIIDTRAEQGCLKFELIQSQQDKYTFLVDELFENKDAFQEHQKRVLLSKWGRLTRNAKRNYQVIERSE